MISYTVVADYFLMMSLTDGRRDPAYFRFFINSEHTVFTKSPHETGQLGDRAAEW